MSALADALAAAQARAVGALAKQYVSGQVDEEALRAALNGIGLNDPADTSQWVAALDIIAATGAALPRENGAKPKDEPATEAQMALVKRLCGEKGQPEPDPPLTKAQAHEVIDTLKAGTYDAGRWSVPF